LEEYESEMVTTHKRVIEVFYVQTSSYP